MASCRHHSGYLADDEAGHPTYVARVQPPKKSLFSEMGHASKPGHRPHPPSSHDPSGSSGRCRNRQGPRPFRSFLDFLVEGQVLESLQTVVEEATERMATVKTEAGVPLVEVQDPVEVPRGGRRARARPSLSTLRRHRARPGLCVGRPNNYPSRSSSMSDSRSSCTAADWPGCHSRDSDLGSQGLGRLPPVTDQLLLEKSLKRLLQLENRGRGLGQASSHGDSLLWDSLDSQSSTQWTVEQPLSWFSGPLGSSWDTHESSELGPTERELGFLRRQLNKEMRSLLSQPASFELPGYSTLREPHRTLDFLAEHHLFPALQNVVNRAVEKLSGARRRDGGPLFPSEWETARESDSKVATPTDGEELYESPPTTASSPRTEQRKSQHKGRAKAKEGGSPVPSPQVATRFRLEVTDTEEPKVSPSLPKQEGLDRDPRVQKPSIPASEPLSSRAQPWQSPHLAAPAPWEVAEAPFRLTRGAPRALVPLASPHPSSSNPFSALSPHPSALRGPSPSRVLPEREVTSSRLGPGVLGPGLQWKGSYRHRS
ncbi:coiled-coil domain-containing protein 116 isoform 1 [Bos taurus]